MAKREIPSEPITAARERVERAQAARQQTLDALNALNDGDDRTAANDADNEAYAALKRAENDLQSLLEKVKHG